MSQLTQQTNSPAKVASEVIDRFWSKVNKTETCWNWTGGCDQDGYGQFMHNYKNYRAHRFSKLIAGEEVPSGMVSRHLCNNAKCVRPDHIKAGTQQENIQDQLVAGTLLKLQFEKSISSNTEVFAQSQNDMASVHHRRLGLRKAHLRMGE